MEGDYNVPPHHHRDIILTSHPVLVELHREAIPHFLNAVAKYRAEGGHKTLAELIDAPLLHSICSMHFNMPNKDYKLIDERLLTSHLLDVS